MMVIAPSFQSVNNEIKVPEINSGVGVETKNATVSISKEGNVYLNGQEITSSSLESELVSLKGSDEEK